MTAPEKKTVNFGTVFTVYMDGIGTGVATLGLTLGYDDATARQWADEILERIGGDPVVMESLKQQVRDRVNGDLKPEPPPLRVFGAGE